VKPFVSKRNRGEGGRRGTDCNVVGTISSPLFPHRKYEGSACSKFGRLAPFDGSTLHSGVKDSLGAGCCTMMSQTISKCTNEFAGSGLRGTMACEKGERDVKGKEDVRPSCVRSWNLHPVLGGPTRCCGGCS
jgi:hypothetical protein